MNKNKIQTQHTEEKGINNDEKILTSKLRFRVTISEDLFPNVSLDNSWVSTVKVNHIRS